MADDPGDPGDAGSLGETDRFRDLVERTRAGNPESTHAPRWARTGNWRPDRGEIVVYAVGYGIIVMVLVMRLLGCIDDR
ncbi:hypothetical protein GXW74_11575 [Roseomonas eburnea]|uniref:Uncharacterized protein n=1 Tax=Neoroseomonas eburnea TaxID=1346889 RepID=A0A9X9XBP3_9PROT|nr:hypothetical protein [Neoroseomonas eburnea]MBR0681129.1 hypothetical protein [Neoroseomonas eburnea]